MTANLSHGVLEMNPKGFGFLHGKPPSALSPLAVTPDALGAAWDGERLGLELRSSINGRLLGRPNAAVDMHFLEDLVADANLHVHGRENAGQ